MSATQSPELLVADLPGWRAWLAANHASSPGVRLVPAKKGVSASTLLTYGDALLEALCYGWIDGHLSRRDGRWERAYGGSASIEVPDDLRDALDASPCAQATWAVLTRTNRYAVLYRVHQAKPPRPVPAGSGSTSTRWNVATLRTHNRPSGSDAGDGVGPGS